MSLNFLCVGDLHLRKSSPAMRTDNFFQTMERKLDFIFETASVRRCLAIIFPGDVFDRPDAPHGLVEWAIRKFRASNHLCLFVYGQHDLRYHTSDKQNSPLGVLIAGLEHKARVLEPDNAYITYDPRSGVPAVIRGCSWGEPMSPFEPIDMLGNVEPINILVMHRPIINSAVPWDHDDMLTTNQLFEACESADVFVCGDNHQRFTKATYEGRLILNMGSVLRTSTAQVDHRPAVALLSIRGPELPIEWEEITIPHRKKVFDMEAVEAKEEQKEKIAEFLAGLQKDYNPELDFLSNLKSASDGCSEGVRKILEEVLQ